MDKLQPRLQKAVDMGISGLDIIHGELKDMMLEAEQELERAQKEEDRLNTQQALIEDGD